MNVAISRALLDQIFARAAMSPDKEICGLLLGGEGRIMQAMQAANIAASPECMFELDPAVLLSAHRAARTGGPRILGHYHSHPTGDSSPSAHDAANAVPGQLWLIIAGDGAALFEAREEGPVHGRFHPVDLTIE